MPTFSCGVLDLATAADCSDKGGLLTVLWTTDDQVDWDTMTGATYFDDTDNSVVQWAMEAAGTWNRLDFVRKQGRMDNLYTRENGYYEVQVLNMIFRGHSAANTYGLAQAAACCNLIAVVFDNNGLSRVIGKEYVDGTWISPLENCVISRHLDTTGGFGNLDDKARDEVDLFAEHNNPPAYNEVSLSAMLAL